MPADPIHPDQLDGEQRFHADLVAYLDSLPVGKLAELLGELPRSRQEPLGLGVLMVALNERLPDAYKLLPPAGHPCPGEGRAARCCRWSLTAAPPAPASTRTRQRRGWPRGWPTACRPTCTPSAPGRARWASGRWPSRPPAARSTMPPGRAGRAGARPAGTGARQRARGRLQRQLAVLSRARRAHPRDLRLDGARAAAAGRTVVAAGP